MHLTIGIKIFGIAVGLLILMAVVALLSMRMTRTVDDQLVIIDHNYFPAYVALAEANIRSVEESAFVRRQLLALAEPTDNAPKVEDLHQRIATAGKASDEEVAAARQHINEQIADPLDFDDNVALARLDVRIWRLASDRGYEIQIDDMGFNVDTGQNFSPLHQTGAVYALAPSSTLASKPAGQWNTFEIEATNPSIKVTLNGQLVTNYSIPASSPRLPAGHIGLQCHTGNVQFRNIMIRSLPD